MSSASASSSSFSSTRCLDYVDKTRHYDSDERFMAVRDLMSELRQCNGTLENPLQISIRDAILRLLDDGNSDVTTIAIKCLSLVVRLLSVDHLVFLVERLAALVSEKSGSAAGGAGASVSQSKLDIVSDGLQTMIPLLSLDHGRLICPKLVKSLLNGLSNAAPTPSEAEISMACLSVLRVVITTFGGEIPAQHSALQQTLMNRLSSPSPSIRKGASQVLAALVLFLDETIFKDLMKFLIQQIFSSRAPESYIQAISAISRAAGVRMGDYLNEIVPKLEQILNAAVANPSSEQDDATLELWETCLGALESLILRCPMKISPHVKQLVKLAKELVTYDPLFSYESEDNQQEPPAQSGGDDDEDGWGEDDGADGWGADEVAGVAAEIHLSSSDLSWKVRRAAVRVLAAFIRVRSDLLKDYYEELCDHLVARFKERDPAVKEEILLCLRDLLRESVVAEKRVVSDSDDLPDSAAPLLSRTRSSYSILERKIPGIVQSAVNQFVAFGVPAEVRTQKAIFAVLRELCLVKRGGMRDCFPLIIPRLIGGIEASGRLADINEDAIELSDLILSSHQPHEFSSEQLAQISKATAALVRSGPVKNIAAALNLLAAIVRILAQSQANYSSMLSDIFSATVGQLRQSDVTIEIKLNSFSTISVMLASFGAALFKQSPADVRSVLALLLDRLANESTREPALHALAAICASSQFHSLSPELAFLVRATPEILPFLRQSNSKLKCETLNLLHSLVRFHSSQFQAAELAAILNDLAQQINESDLAVSALALDLASLVMEKAPAKSNVTQFSSDGEIMQRAARLSSSPLVQGHSLVALTRFFSHFVSRYESSSADVMARLLASVNPQLSKPSIAAIAKCLAAATPNNTAALQNAINKFVGLVNQSQPAHLAQLALLYLGEQGKQRDLSQFAQLQGVCLAAFESPVEEVRAAAAYALGNIAVGNLDRFLPLLVDLIHQRPGQGYLLFSSLKEIILHFADSPAKIAQFRPSLSSLIPLLFDPQHVRGDESTRDALSETIGRSIAFFPAEILDRLSSLLRSPDINARKVAISALRFAFSPHLDYSELKRRIPEFCSAVRDSDLEVKRQAFITISAISRASAQLLESQLSSTIMPALFEWTAVKPELCQEVDYGAFKKIIDDGKPLRNAAFECLATLLNRAPHKLDLQQFIKHIQAGLNDSEDIQLTVYRLFAELGRDHQPKVLEVLDSLPDLMMPSVKANIAKAKTQNANGANTEAAQASECLRAALKAVLTFNRIPGVELATKYTHFVKQIRSTAVLVAILKEMGEE